MSPSSRHSSLRKPAEPSSLRVSSPRIERLNLNHSNLPPEDSPVLRENLPLGGIVCCTLQRPCVVHSWLQRFGSRFADCHLRSNSGTHTGRLLFPKPFVVLDLFGRWPRR